MYYIKSTPSENGNYGNPMGQPFADCLALHGEDLATYLAAMGFVYVTTDGNTVTGLEPNQEALDAYLADHPDVEPEEPADDIETRVTALESAIERGLSL